METVLNYIDDKIDSDEILIVKDEHDKNKSYITESGHIIGIQINTGKVTS